MIRDNIFDEIARRITLASIVFNKTSNTLKSRLYNQYMLPMLTYEADTWSPSKNWLKTCLTTKDT